MNKLDRFELIIKNHKNTQSSNIDYMRLFEELSENNYTYSSEVFENNVIPNESSKNQRK